MQVVNTLYSLPLHGVRCQPFCRQASSAIKCVDLDFYKIDKNNFPDPIWQLTDVGARYYSNVSVYSHPKNSLLGESSCRSDFCYYLQIECQGNGLFKIDSDRIVVDWEARGTDSVHYFQTFAMALYLELNNVLCIHANGLSYHNKGLAVVAPSRTGKTTLSMSLVRQGFELMSDDMIAIHQHENKYQIYPSWPVARMWPDSLAAQALTDSETTTKVHQDFDKRIININQSNGYAFCDTPQTLKVIYLLNRIESSEQSNFVCEIESVPKAKGVITLLQNSMLGGCYRELGIESLRLNLLADLLDSVSFKQVNYHSGFEHLIAVGEAIKADLYDCK